MADLFQEYQYLVGSAEWLEEEAKKLGLPIDERRKRELRRWKEKDELIEYAREHFSDVYQVYALLEDKMSLLHKVLGEKDWYAYDGDYPHVKFYDVRKGKRMLRVWETRRRGGHMMEAWEFQYWILKTIALKAFKVKAFFVQFSEDFSHFWFYELGQSRLIFKVDGGLAMLRRFIREGL